MSTSTIGKEEDFVTFLKKMLAMLPKAGQNAKVNKSKVSGIIMFSSQDKVLIFASKGGPDPAVIHAIVDRGNNMVVGYYFSETEYMMSDKLCHDIMYRLQPFAFSK